MGKKRDDKRKLLRSKGEKNGKIQEAKNVKSEKVNDEEKNVTIMVNTFTENIVEENNSEKMNASDTIISNIIIAFLIIVIFLLAMFMLSVVYIRFDSHRLTHLPLENIKTTNINILVQPEDLNSEQALPFIRSSSVFSYVITWASFQSRSLIAYLRYADYKYIFHSPDGSPIFIANSLPAAAAEFSDRSTLERCSHYSCVNIEPCLADLPSYNEGDHRLAHKQLIKVYIYPNFNFFYSNEQGLVHLGTRIPQSRQFMRMLQGIMSSVYFTDNPDEACVFVVNLDFLNFGDLQRDDPLVAGVMESILWSLPYFQQSNGSNHLIFSMFPKVADTTKMPKESKTSLLDYSLGQAMMAGGGLDNIDYRLYFDIVTPVYSLYSELFGEDRGKEDIYRPMPKLFAKQVNKLTRPWTLIALDVDSVEVNETLQRLESIYSNRVLLVKSGDCEFSKLYQKFESRPNSNLPRMHLDHKIEEMFTATATKDIFEHYHQHLVCNHERRLAYRYIDLLHRSTFCLITRRAANGESQQLLMTEALMSGCIPVVMVDDLVMPFEIRLDWRLASIRLWEHELPELIERLDSITEGHREQLRNNAFNFWWLYFRSPGRIAVETLDILNNRLFPRPENINSMPETSTAVLSVTPMTPEFYQQAGYEFITPKQSYLQTAGFTAVVLAYNRLTSLYEIVNSLLHVPSCAKVLIVWNNVDVDPPDEYNWPQSNVPIEVIRTEENLIGNRFFPFDSITTEAIFSIDDDITMLTIDEIEFAYQTWCEFPDRLVGFPSRLHRWSNYSRAYIYDSEWRNQYSMILTGAAFYHRVIYDDHLIFF